METIRLAHEQDKDTRTLKEILDEINDEASSLPYLNHRIIQEDLVTILNRYENICQQTEGENESYSV